MSDRPGADLLLSLPRFTDQGASAYRPGLERIRALLSALGDPHLRFPSVHVAGTNGKGSTASMIAAIGTSLGMRIGLHTSPHLVDVTERMRVNGVNAPVPWLESQVMEHREVIERIAPSFFEATTALSFLYFAEAGVDAAVVEVGMGGRLDATNVLMPEVCAITHIGLDHTEHLGTTLASIAREKAGIAKPSRPLVLYPAPVEVEEAVEEVCSRTGAPLHLVRHESRVRAVSQDGGALIATLETTERVYERVTVELPGAHQLENAAVAVRAAELAWQGAADIDAAVRTGLATVSQKTGLRGRMQTIQTEPVIVVDVAHNADGLAPVLRSLVDKAAVHGAHIYVLIAVMSDKDIEGMARLLVSTAHAVYCVSLNTPRAMDAGRVADVLRNAGVEVRGIGSLQDALRTVMKEASDNDIILLTGSHVLVGEYLATTSSK